MRRLTLIAATLLLAGCGLPSKDRVQGELQTIADAGAPPDAVAVELVSMSRGDGDLSGINHHVAYDLKVFRDGPLLGPLVGGRVEARAGERWTGGKALLVYERIDGGPWTITGLRIEQLPSPAPRP
ncbi:MAG: hypothetical protein Q8J89_02830 [Caulobacter sp.]|nr:hypothetical protein [Caulobacter sp.]